jgi:hypothetical protein
MTQDTSLEIYLRKVYPDLGHRQAVVLHFLRYAGGAHTNAEIAAALGKRINEITPRTFELRKLGLVLDGGRRNCKITGNTAHQWKAKYPVLPEAFPKPEPNVEAAQQPLL